MYIEAPDAHFASQLGKGSWPKPKQKATVVSPQIACSEYRSTTEANGEERWLCSEWAPGKTDGIYQAIERRESWLQVCEAPQKWSIDLGDLNYRSGLKIGVAHVSHRSLKEKY